MTTRERPDANRLQAWAHRKGLARTLGITFSGGRYLSAHVETAVPSLRLALYAARLGPMRVVEVQRYGRFRRRYFLRPCPSAR